MAVLGLVGVLAPTIASSGAPTTGVHLPPEVSPGQNIVVYVFCPMPAISINLAVDQALSNGFVSQSSPQPFGGPGQGSSFPLTVQNVPGIHEVSATCFYPEKDLGFPTGKFTYFPDHLPPLSFTVKPAPVFEVTTSTAPGGGGGGGGSGGGGGAGSEEFEFTNLFGSSLLRASLLSEMTLQSVVLLLSPPAPTPPSSAPPTTAAPTTVPPATAAPTSLAPSTSTSSTTTTTDPNAPCPPNCKP